MVGVGNGNKIYISHSIEWLFNLFQKQFISKIVNKFIKTIAIIYRGI